MGRIGRMLVRSMLFNERGANRLRAINSIYPVETVAHLLKYDTVHGTWEADIRVHNGRLIINGNEIEVVYHRDPEQIPWAQLGVDIAIDATGQFNDRAGASKHLTAGARKVIITAPGQGMDMTIVMGVNDHLYSPDEHTLLSAASCTTNCVAPLLYVLHQSFQVQSGWMTTVHAYTSDQNHLDNPHKDLRRARACTQSIVPTTTGVGKALKDVLPHLSSHIHGTSLRVPTQDVSLVDLTVKVKYRADPDEVKAAFLEASSGKLAPYLGYTSEPLVSADFIGNSKSAVVDGLSLMTYEDQIKVLAWYDNEWAYACRVAELANLVLERGTKPWQTSMAL